MRVFIEVARLGSFTSAAEVLGMPRASVSLAVQRLESHLGVRLLHRTTRRVNLTQDGQTFFERSQDVLADFDELQGMFQSESGMLRGRLRVDMPLAVARDVVLPGLPAFLVAHPQLQIEISSTDRFVDLVQEGFDCILRVGKLAESSLVARPVGQYHMVNCVSAAYLAQYGCPHTLDDLDSHRLVHYASVLGARPPGFEYLEPGTAEHAVFRVMQGNVTVNNSDAYLQACLAGLGIIQVPEVGVHALLENGVLREILHDFRPAPMPVSILYANRRHLPRRARVFMDWMALLMKERLEGQGLEHL